MRLKGARSFCATTMAITLVLCLAFSLFSVFVRASSTDRNRFNVMIVLDASGSMNRTDKGGLRFEAINQFTNLLAEQGNYLGGIVFSTKISAQQEPTAINSQGDKDAVISVLKSVKAGGWTNIGEALLFAVNSLNEKGDPTLPSVVIFLSDGNTEMASEKETSASLDLKADAIQKARESGVAIYSICLNADDSADVSEMEQISQATGGVFREVGSAEDLGEVFNTFYNLIYGTSTIILVDETFPQSGIVEKEFEIPGIGVEEVNVIIYGKISNLALFKPDGTESSATATTLSSLTMLKVTDVVPGKWRIVTTGVRGDQIKINMVYNTNLGVDILLANDESTVDTETTVTVKASLKSGGQAATNESQYAGYSAQLHVLDSYDNEITSTPMPVVGDHFEVDLKFDEGVYKFKATITGNHIDRESEVIGPLTVVSVDGEADKTINTPPEPVENPVKKTVNIWPFKGGKLTIDMSELAIDHEDDHLVYQILSSSFIEGTDYTVVGDAITLDHFSLSKGSFDIKATDSGGLSCNIEVLVTTRNVGIIALIGLGAGALLVLIIFGIVLYVALSKPFRGTVLAQSYCNGTYRGVPRTKKRGRIKLSAFGMEPTGLDYNKSYFQATGKNFIYLVTNKPVIWNGQKTSKIRVQGGIDVTITVTEGDNRLLYVRFDSRMKGGPTYRPVVAGGARRRKRPVRR